MKIVAWVAVGLGLLILALLGVCGLVNLLLGAVPMPDLVGNGKANVPLVASGEGPFKIGVLGDTQKGQASLARVLEVLKKEDVDFIIHTGDLVSENDEGHYRLAALTFHRAKLWMPCLVVPGNHDIKGGDARFMRELGPPEFIFRRGAVGFVGLDNASGIPLGTDMELPEPNPSDPAVVLLMHVPPFDVEGNVLPGWEPFVAWLEKSSIRYVLSGQVHAYLRKEVGGTVVIANGVGGDYESWQLDQKVYATILEVDGTKITDRRIEIEAVHGFMENLEHLAIGHVAEAYRRNPWACWFGTVLIVAWVAGAIWLARRR